MNTPEYRKGYAEYLKLQIANNDKNLMANKGNPAAQQYMQNTGKTILGISTFQGQPSNVKSNGKK
jgi:hypothetical protein